MRKQIDLPKAPLVLFFVFLIFSCGSSNTITGIYTVKYNSKDWFRDDSYYQLEIRSDSIAIFTSYIFSTHFMQSFFRIKKIGNGKYALTSLYDRKQKPQNGIPLDIRESNISNKEAEFVQITFTNLNKSVDWVLLFLDKAYYINPERTLKIKKNNGSATLLCIWYNALVTPINDTIWSRPFEIRSDSDISITIDSSYLDMFFFTDNYDDSIYRINSKKIKMIRRNHVLKKSKKKISAKKFILCKDSVVSDYHS